VRIVQAYPRDRVLVFDYDASSRSKPGTPHSV
jgi:hypothetical protein